MTKPPLTDRNLTYLPASQTQARYRVIYGGAGSGKSVFIAQDFIAKLSARKRRLIVFRKVAKTIYYSTYTLFKDILTAMGRLGDVKHNESRMSFTFPNGSEIIHAGLDDVLKLKSLAAPTDIWFEEATEADFPAAEGAEPDLAQIDLRLRGISDGQITLSFNPRIEALKIFDYLKVPTADLPVREHKHFDGGNVYVQHTTYLDNRWVGPEYVATFDRLGGVMRAVYMEGKLVAVDAPDQLIKYEWVKAAFERDRDDHDGRGRLAIDVARFGDDETVLGRFEGWTLAATEAYPMASTTEAGRRAVSIAQEHAIPADLIAVDTVGVGGGTADIMRDDGLDVAEFIAGASPVDLEGDDWPDFNNIRSQAWWYLRVQLQAGRIAFSSNLDDTVKRKLQEDLLAPRYRFAAEKKIEVEPKDGKSKAWGIKRRLGRSPDYGDTVMMGVFAEHLGKTDDGFFFG